MFERFWNWANNVNIWYLLAFDVYVLIGIWVHAMLS